MSTSSSGDSTEKSIESNVLKKKITSKDIDIWDVIQLDSNIEPVSKPSDMFEKLEEKRKNRHEKVLTQLKRDLYDVNVKTEKNITISSTEIKAHMKYFNDCLEEILKSIDIPEVESYNPSVFLEFQNQASSFKSQQQKLVDELYEDLNKFENQRSDENEKLLRNACEEIGKIGYFLPYKVQAFVEHETMKMNQQSLNNRRCFEDLRLTLTLITEQTYKSFMDKVFCIKEKWADCKADEPCLDRDKTEQTSSNPAPDSYTRLELTGKELQIEVTSNDLYSSCESSIWFKNVQDVVSVLECCARNLIEVYRKTLDAIFSGFDANTNVVRSEIASFQNVIIQERNMQPLRFESSSCLVKEIENLEIFWQNNLTCIRALLDDGVEFLKNVGDLWNRHRDRIDEIKKLILKAVEKAIDDNQAVIQDLETKLNIGLDALRQEFVPNKLEKTYEAVIGLLNSVKAKYEGFFQNYVSIIKDYNTMLSLEADVLSAELKEFIYGMHYIDVTKIPQRYSDAYRCFPEGKPIRKQIYACLQQIKAISYWKQGVWIALERLSLNTKEALEPQAEKWIQKKIEILSEKYAVQVEILNKRFERIRNEIYEKRKNEVESHKNDFEQLKEKVKTVFLKINQNLKMMTNKKLNELEEMKTNFEGIESKAKEETRAGVICSTRIRVEKKKENLEKNLRLSYGRYLADCETEILDLKTSNIVFIKNIKLFHEGGRYSTEEGKTFAGLLETVDKDITTEFKNILKNTNKDENEVLKKCPQMFAPTLDLLSSLYEETLFHQKVLEKMSDFQTKLTGLSDSLKSDFQLLKQKTDCLVKIVESSGQTLNENHYNFWLTLLQNLYKNVSNLFYPMNLAETPVSNSLSESQNENVGEEDEPCLCLGTTGYSTQATASRTPTFRTAEIEENLVCKDFKKGLFDTEDPPENDGTFMAIVSNSIWAEMDAIQKLACSFYRKIQKQKVVREDLIPTNYEAFVNETLLKFRCYNIQCEQLWLQTVLDFLPLLGQIKQSTNLYIERTLKEYQHMTLLALKKYEEDFLACLESQSSEASNRFEFLSGKLLALHGSPKNKDLLSHLEEEVVQRTANLGIAWEAAIKKFQNSIRCFRLRKLQDKEDIGKIQIQLNKMTEKLFINDLGNNLLRTIMDFVNRGGFCTQRTSMNSPTDEVPDKYKLNLSENLLNVQSYFELLRSLVEVELMHREENVGCLSNSEDSIQILELYQQKLNILLQPFDSESFVSEVLEKLNECLKKMNEMAKSKKNVQEETLFKWLEVWKFNVKKTEELFRVKYEEAPEGSRKDPDIQSGKHCHIFILHFCATPTLIYSSRNKFFSGSTLKKFHLEPNIPI